MADLETEDDYEWANSPCVDLAVDAAELAAERGWGPEEPTEMTERLVVAARASSTVGEVRRALADPRAPADAPIFIRLVDPTRRQENGAYLAEEHPIIQGFTGWEDGYWTLLAGASLPLTLEGVSRINRQRCKRWHGRDTEPWTAADWSNAMAGEAGEACNVVKKIRRHETNTSTPNDPDLAELVEMLADELADTYLYLDLLANHFDIDLPKAIADKFNRVSETMGFPERLDA